MADKIIEELWKIKDGIAHEHGYNVDALVAHFQEKGPEAGQIVVGLGAMIHLGSKKPGRGRIVPLFNISNK